MGRFCPIVASAGYCDYGHVKTSSQLSDLFSVTVMGAPSRIRTCAHGSGGGKPHLSNWCISPARSRSLISLVAKLIPRIFRIMESSAVTTRSLGEWPASGPGRLRSGPWFLTGVSAVAPGSSVTLRVRWPVPFHLCWLPCVHSRAWGWRGGYVPSAGHPWI